MTALRRAFTMLLAATVLLTLTGCAVPRLIDSDVQSFVPGAAPQRPASYRFERLPSQGDSAAQDKLEAMAALALARVELTAAPSARYAVQVSARVQAIASPHADPVMGGFWERGYDRRFGGAFGFGGFSLFLEPSWVRHAVHIVLRDSASGKPLYESSATFDGPWNDSARLLPVLLDAALRDYPNPPAGPRKVVIELPGEQADDQ